MTELFRSRKHFFCMIFPLVLCLIYLGFCVINLNSSIWFDEAFSAYLIRGDFADIWSLTAADVHPPFFYFCLKIWSLIFGTSAVALRFMSIFFGGIAIIFAFQLVKKWFGVKTAAISTALLSVAPIFIRYGQEMRMYTLVFAIVLAATYVLELALEHPKKKLYWILYAVLMAIGMWTHYFVALAWIAQLIYLAFVHKQKFWKRPLLPAYLLAVLLYIPWLPFFISQVGNVQKGFWIPEVSASTPVDYYAKTTLFTEALEVKNWLVFLLLGVVIFTTILTVRVFKQAKASDRKHLTELLCLVILPPILLMILSLPPLKPVFVDRYVLYAASLIWLLAGVIIASGFSRHKLLAGGLAAMMIASATIGIYRVETREPEGYVKDIVSLTVQSAAESEPILVNSVWNYYDAIFYSDDTHKIYLPNDWVAYQYGSEEPVKKYHLNVIDDLSAFTKDHQTIWYITDLPDSDSVSNKLSNMSGELASPLEGYEVTSEISNGHHIALELRRKS